jgi:hypothetical protein
MQRPGGTLSIPSGGELNVKSVFTFSGTVVGPGKVTITSGATLLIAPTAKIRNGARLINGGHAEIQSNGFNGEYLFNGSVLENAGTLTLDDNVNVTDDGNAANLVQNDPGATIDFAQTPSAIDPDNIDTTLANYGTLRLLSGTLTVSTLTNLVAGKLTRGTYVATAGTLYLPGPITTNAADISLGATGQIIGGGTNALASLGSNTGTLDLGQSLALSGGLSNSGHISVLAGTLQAASVAQNAGSISISKGAKLIAGASGNGPITLGGGSLTGNGTVVGVLSGAGTVNPGRSAGPLTVTGSFAPAPGGDVTVGIGGPLHPGTDFGQLVVTGRTSLAGTLVLATDPNCKPPIGASVPIMFAGSLTGTFGAVTGTQLSGVHLVVTYTATSVILTAAAG